MYTVSSGNADVCLPLGDKIAHLVFLVIIGEVKNAD